MEINRLYIIEEETNMKLVDLILEEKRLLEQIEKLET
jgi:hypothetical protein